MIRGLKWETVTPLLTNVVETVSGLCRCDPAGAKIRSAPETLCGNSVGGIGGVAWGTNSVVVGPEMVR